MSLGWIFDNEIVRIDPKNIYVKNDKCPQNDQEISFSILSKILIPPLPPNRQKSDFFFRYQKNALHINIYINRYS
jgi:hypothetical protein